MASPIIYVNSKRLRTWYAVEAQTPHKTDCTEQGVQLSVQSGFAVTVMSTAEKNRKMHRLWVRKTDIISIGVNEIFDEVRPMELINHVPVDRPHDIFPHENFIILRFFHQRNQKKKKRGDNTKYITYPCLGRIFTYVV